jgi:hypothetical protein
MGASEDQQKEQIAAVWNFFTRAQRSTIVGHRAF